MTNAPETLNGYPVIQSMTHRNGYVTVMVERHGEHMPYVVATYWPELKTSWEWGHYSHHMDEAESNFSVTVKRNNNRGTIN